jgi:hypothetical protein
MLATRFWILDEKTVPDCFIQYQESSIEYQNIFCSLNAGERVSI